MIRAYADALPELHARQQLDRIEAASVAHMAEEQQREVFRRLNEQLGASSPAAAKAAPATVADLAAIGIEVEYVPKEVIPDD